MSEMVEDRVARALCEADGCSWEQFSGDSHFRERAKVAIAAMQPTRTSTKNRVWKLGDSISYGVAIFRNKEGQRVVYHLCHPAACDLGTDVNNFKPRDFLEITVEDHDGSGWWYRYLPGDDAIEMATTVDLETGADITAEDS